MFYTSHGVDSPSLDTGHVGGFCEVELHQVVGYIGTNSQYLMMIAHVGFKSTCLFTEFCKCGPCEDT